MRSLAKALIASAHGKQSQAVAILAHETVKHEDQSSITLTQPYYSVRNRDLAGNHYLGKRAKQRRARARHAFWYAVGMLATAGGTSFNAALITAPQQNISNAALCFAFAGLIGFGWCAYNWSLLTKH